MRLSKEVLERLIASREVKQLARERFADIYPAVIDPRSGTIRYGKATFSPECSALFRARRELAGGLIPDGQPCDACGRPNTAYFVEAEPFVHHYVCRVCGHHSFD